MLATKNKNANKVISIFKRIKTNKADPKIEDSELLSVSNFILSQIEERLSLSHVDIDLRDIATLYQHSVANAWSKSETGYEISTANTKLRGQRTNQNQRNPNSQPELLGVDSQHKGLDDVFEDGGNQSVTESNPLLGERTAVRD